MDKFHTTRFRRSPSPKMDAIDKYEKWDKDWLQIKKMFNTTGMDENVLYITEEGFLAFQKHIFQKLEREYGSLLEFVNLSVGSDADDEFKFNFRAHLLEHLKRPGQLMSRPIPNYYIPPGELDTPSSEDKSDCSEQVATSSIADVTGSPEQLITPESPVNYLVADTSVVTKQANSLNLDVAPAPNPVAIPQLIKVHMTTPIGATKVSHSVFRTVDAATAAKLVATTSVIRMPKVSKVVITPIGATKAYSSLFRTVVADTAAKLVAQSATIHAVYKQGITELRYCPVRPSTGRQPSTVAESSNRYPILVPSIRKNKNTCYKLVINDPSMQKPKPVATAAAAVTNGCQKGAKGRKTNADKSIARYNTKLQRVEPKKQTPSTSGADYKPGPHIGISKVLEEAIASSADPKVTKPSSFSVVPKTSVTSVNYRKNQGNEEQVDMIRVLENKVGAKRRSSHEQYKNRSKMIRVSVAKDGEKLRMIENISKTPNVEISTIITPSQKSTSSSSTGSSPTCSSSCSSSPDCKIPRDRSRHNTAERKRREEEKVSLHRLRDILPGLENQSRISKQDICDTATNHIKILEQVGINSEKLLEENRIKRGNLRIKLRSIESERAQR